MEEQKLLLKYYLIKRLFLFIDEWLFYFTLYSLVWFQYYLIAGIILAYGTSCIYISYSNIEKIENKLTGIKQDICILTKSNDK